MPPKKKAGGSGSLSESQGKGAILQIFNQLDQDKINALSKRVDEAVSERMELQKKLDKGEKETQKLADYFQQELDLKDVLVGKQRLELKEAETKLEEKVAELTESYDEKIKTMEEDWNRTETGLRARLRIVEENLQRLESFRQSQKQVEKEVSQLKAAAEETARKHKVDLADLVTHTDAHRTFLQQQNRKETLYHRSIYISFSFSLTPQLSFYSPFSFFLVDSISIHLLLLLSTHVDIYNPVYIYICVCACVVCVWNY